MNSLSIPFRVDMPLYDKERDGINPVRNEFSLLGSMLVITRASPYRRFPF